MKIYITRHGETEWNIQKRMQGNSNSELTTKGIEEAKKLAKSIENIKFDYIYSSPLKRAYDTAEIIKDGRECEIIIRDNLREMSFGIWEGMSREEILEIYEEEHNNFWNYPHLFSGIDGGETYIEFVERIKNEMEYIINNSNGENILLVVHGAVIKAIFKIFKGYDLNEFWSAMPFIHNTCLSILEIDGEDNKFLLEGDISHLE